MQRATVLRCPSKKVCLLKLPPTNLDWLTSTFCLFLPSVQGILFGTSLMKLVILNLQQVTNVGMLGLLTQTSEIEHIWNLWGLQPGRHRFKKHLNCLLMDCKMKGLMMAEKWQAIVSYKGCSCRIVWSWQEIRVIVKKVLFGVQDGCIVTGYRPIRPWYHKVAAGRCFSEYNSWCPWVWYGLYKVQVLSGPRVCLRPDPQWPLNSIFVCLSFYYSIVISSCPQFYFCSIKLTKNWWRQT